MELGNYNVILDFVGAISAIGGAWYTILKILREIRKSKKADYDRILDQAKEHNAATKAKLETRIELLEADFHNLEESMAKDFAHIKETQANELRNLGEKIENLREEIKTAHTSLINLLTKLVDKG